MSRRLFVGLFAALALYADVTGKWVGTSEKADPAGKTHREAIYLQLRQSGNNLTGVIGSQGAQEFEISQGKIDGNQVSFVRAATGVRAVVISACRFRRFNDGREYRDGGRKGR